MSKTRFLPFDNLSNLLDSTPPEFQNPGNGLQLQIRRTTITTVELFLDGYRYSDPMYAIGNVPTNEIMSRFGCFHNWVEMPGEPPIDVCNECGEIRQ